VTPSFLLGELRYIATPCRMVQHAVSRGDFQLPWSDNGRPPDHGLCKASPSGIHVGIIRASGETSVDITRELGVRAGRRPLLHLHGDRSLQ